MVHRPAIGQHAFFRPYHNESAKNGDLYIRRIADLDAVIAEAQETKRRLEETIACQCEGDTSVCPVFRADAEAVG